MIIIILSSLLVVLAAALVWMLYLKRTHNDPFVDIVEWLTEKEDELKSRGCVEIHILKGEDFLAYLETQMAKGITVPMTVSQAREMKDSLILIGCDAEGHVVGDPQMFDKSKSLYLLDRFNGKPIITITL